MTQQSRATKTPTIATMASVDQPSDGIFWSCKRIVVGKADAHAMIARVENNIAALGMFEAGGGDVLRGLIEGRGEED